MVYTIYIQKINNFRLVVCSPAYCLNEINLTIDNELEPQYHNIIVFRV